MYLQKAVRGSTRTFHKLWKLSDVLGLERQASAPVVGVHKCYLLGRTRACTGGPGIYCPRSFDTETGKDLGNPMEEITGWSDLVRRGKSIRIGKDLVDPDHWRYFDSDTGEELVHPGTDQTAWRDLICKHSISIDMGYGSLWKIVTRWEKLAPRVRQTAKMAASAITCLQFMQGGELFGESSGTIIHPSGLILTCAEALGSSSRSKEDLAKLKVSVAVDPGNGGDFSYRGAVVYADFHYDIAIIKISSKSSLEAARLGSFYELCPSTSVLYLGSYTKLTPIRCYPQIYVSHCELISGQTMTIDQGGTLEHLLPVSLAPSLYVDPLAPTDATGKMLTPLGGPLVNPCGEVVGMISNRSSKSYAVPVDLIRKIIDHFVKYGRVIRPWLGVRLTFLSEGSKAQTEENNISIHNVIKGFLVVKVIPESPGDRAGFLPGDVVVEIDGKCIGSSKELTDVLWDKVGVPLEVIVKRSTDNSMTLTLTVVPEEARLDVSKSEHTTDL